MKAGDLAPDLHFYRVRSSPENAAWSQSNLLGKLTLVLFFSDTSHNRQSVTKWNALIEKFASQPVQFVWITAETELTLGPFLARHPVGGWVLLDGLGATSHAYGLEVPASVFIGPDRRVLGFGPPFVPEERTITGALESRPIGLNPAPPRMPRPEDHRPDFPASYNVHITPSAKDCGSFAGMDYFNLQAYDLRTAACELYDVSPVRIVLPPRLDNAQRYDFAMVLPAPEEKDQIYQRLRRGIQDHFQVDVAREMQSLDVYGMTSIGGRLPAKIPRARERYSHSSSLMFQVAMTGSGPRAGLEPVAIDAIRGVSIDGTVDELCQLMERQLDRPVVNETEIDGQFSFRLELPHDAPNNFLNRMREQWGLIVTPARRQVEMMVFRDR